MTRFKLISFKLCPYVQRAAIAQLRGLSGDSLALAA